MREELIRKEIDHFKQIAKNKNQTISLEEKFKEKPFNIGKKKRNKLRPGEINTTIQIGRKIRKKGEKKEALGRGTEPQTPDLWGWACLAAARFIRGRNLRPSLS